MASRSTERAAPELVAIIGVGAMGTPIALRLLDQGFRVLACDRNQSALDELAAAGAATTHHSVDCAQADVVLVLVATPTQVRDVTGDLFAEATEPSRAATVLIMSTVPAEVVIEASNRLAARRVLVLDAPVSGGVLRARNGSLSIMAGATSDELEWVRPVLEAMAVDVFACGSLGSGSTVKIINNIVGTASTMALAEACRIARECGLDLDEVVPVLDASSGRTYLTRDAKELEAFFSQLTRTRADFDALSGIMRKDFGLAVDLAAGLQGSYPLLSAMKIFADGLGDESFDNWRAAGVGSGAPSHQSTQES